MILSCIVCVKLCAVSLLPSVRVRPLILLLLMKSLSPWAMWNRQEFPIRTFGNSLLMNLRRTVERNMNLRESVLLLSLCGSLTTCGSECGVCMTVTLFLCLKVLPFPSIIVTPRAPPRTCGNGRVGLRLSGESIGRTLLWKQFRSYPCRWVPYLLCTSRPTLVPCSVGCSAWPYSRHRVAISLEACLWTCPSVLSVVRLLGLGASLNPRLVIWTLKNLLRPE